MPSPLRSRRVPTLLTAAAVLVAASVSSLPAVAAATSGTATTTSSNPGVQTPTEVTAFLRAPDLSGLQSLAAAKGLTHAQRIARLQALTPSTADLTRVADGLRSQGLDVTHETAWSVTATGSVGTVADTFGTRPTLAQSDAPAARAAATAALPRTPSSLSGLVAGVYPTTSGPATFHAQATGDLDGTDFRNAYTAANVTPTTGLDDGQATIATMQLADFDSSDLTAYAQKHGLTDPVAAGRYRSVTVDGGPTADDDKGADEVEAALDQEALLSTAPSAHQQVYFAPNTNAGYADVFASVYDDAVGNSLATDPNSHIMAMSTSWGNCETLTRASGVKAVEPVLTALEAAGVTVFAASGDDGIYDCGPATGSGENHQADVDFPASSPEVVAVGGSHLQAASNLPNTGHNWSESGWGCTAPDTCEAGGGSGGGASGEAYGTTTQHTVDNFKGFGIPAYQKDTVKDAPFAGATHRLVPDIASNGDPSSGFTITSNNPAIVSYCGTTCTFGGTSLASPLAAAELTNTLADKGITSGVGDIHAALYSAYVRTASLPSTSSAKVFRDITSGSNGASANRGADPSVTAHQGYDTVSGLGGVLWPALVRYLTNTATPRATASEKVLSAGHGESRIRLLWNSSAGSDTNALAPATVTLTRAGHIGVLWSSSSATSGDHHITLPSGHTYVLAVVAHDIAGRHSPTVRVRLPVPHS